MTETESEVIFLDEEGIMNYIAKDIKQHNLQHAIENMEAAKKILNGRPPALSLIDIRKARKISVEARNYYTNEKNSELIKACVLVTGSPVSKIIGNFFIGLNKTSFPLKIVTSKEDGVKWLKEQ